MEDSKYTHLVIVFLLTIIAGNLLFLDLKVFSPDLSVKVSDITSVVSPTIQSVPDSSSCPQACISLIDRVNTTNNVALGTTPNSPTNPQVIISTSTHESYIPLGSGSTSKTTWEDLTATETIIDTSNYGKIKEAYFIASLRNPTKNGSVEAQLYNVTDKHPVWYSPITMGTESQTLSSSKITLDNGNKLYRVQLKSTLGVLVYLDNAKIRIVTE